MHIVEYIDRSGRVFDSAVSTPKELFSLIYILDISTQVRCWKIINNVPSDFGWSSQWNKLVDKYTEEHFKPS